MAKIGNETKLLLKLVTERQENKLLAVINGKHNSDFVVGYKRANESWIAELSNAVYEIEK